MPQADAPWHAHVYFTAGEREAAAALRDRFADLVARGEPGPVLFVGAMTEGKAGPHPLPQYEIHFRERFLQTILEVIRASGLRALVHPLTDDDLADHTSLGQWIGEPLPLDLSTRDP